MADYNPNRNPNWNYGGRNWKLSRSKIDGFLRCPRCFYIDNKLGTKEPGGPPFMINSAVDFQLKQEFDVHRAKGTQHPLMEKYGIDAVPARHEKIDSWRENFQGVQTKHEPTGMTISGAIDDLWVNPAGEHLVVDYKATASKEPIIELDDEKEFHGFYKKQLEVYQWLLRRNGLKVSDTGYFVYCTGKFDQEAFDGKIEFDVNVIPYEGNDSWVEPVIMEIKQCLDSEVIPQAAPQCEMCRYHEARNKHERGR